MRKWIAGVLLILGVSSAQATKEIIILEVNSNVPNMVNIHYLFWIPTAKPIQKQNFQSAWSGVSSPELALLQAGSLIEENYSETFGQSETVANIKAHLVAKWNDRNAYFQSQAAPGQFFGTFFDSSTSWSQ